MAGSKYQLAFLEKALVHVYCTLGDYTSPLELLVAGCCWGCGLESLRGVSRMWRLGGEREEVDAPPRAPGLPGQARPRGKVHLWQYSSWPQTTASLGTPRSSPTSIKSWWGANGCVRNCSGLLSIRRLFWRLPGNEVDYYPMVRNSKTFSSLASKFH